MSAKMTKINTEELRIMREATARNGASREDSVTNSDSIGAPSTPNNELYLALHNLPSLGKFYKNPVKAQPLKVMDAIILNNVTSDNYVDRYSEIFAKRVTGVTPEEMFSIDQDYILIWLRENSFPGYPYMSERFKCSGCGKIIPPTEFHYSQFSFKSNADEIDAMMTSIELESGLVVNMYMRRRHHDILVDKYIEDEYTSVGHTVDKEKKDLLKICAVLSIPGCGDIGERASYLEHSMSPLEFIELLAKMKEHNMKCTIGAMINCPHCEASNNVAFFFRAKLFLPSYQAGGSSSPTVQPVEDEQ